MRVFRADDQRSYSAAKKFHRVTLVRGENGASMVLQKLIIEDFLSIRGKIEVDFDSRVTILLGANDHGKSNILRALSCLNNDQVITEEDRNWDAADGQPSLTFKFQLRESEREDLQHVLTALQIEYTEAM
jgi:recombinational DNA repair ATPase RecF